MKFLFSTSTLTVTCSVGPHSQFSSSFCARSIISIISNSFSDVAFSQNSYELVSGANVKSNNAKSITFLFPMMFCGK